MPPIVDGIAICEENRFSEYVLPDDADGIRILRSWQQWLASSGVPSVRPLTGRGYAIYRNGLIPIDAE